MIFQESDPIEALKRYLADNHGARPAESAKTPGVDFPPFRLDDFAALFSVFTGQSIGDYLPAEFTEVGKGLLITSLQAIQQEDESRGLSLTLSDNGVYRLEFAVEWTTPWHIYDFVEIADSFVAFSISYSAETGVAVSATVGSGKVKFVDYSLDLDVTVQIPSFLIEARLNADSETAGAASGGMAKDYLGSLQKPGADTIFIEDIRLSAAPMLSSYRLHLSVLDVLDLHDKFRVDRFQAEINYRGGAGTTDYAILAYTDIEIGFEQQPLVIALTAELEKDAAGTRWAFSGSIAHPITVDQIMQDLAALFGAGDSPAENPHHLPEFIANTQLNYLGLSFAVVSGAAGEQDYTFTLGLSLPVEGQDVLLEMYAHYQKQGAAYELDLTGALNLDGFQLAVAFAKTSDGHGKSDTLVLGGLQTPLKLDSRDLIHAIAPDMAEDVPLEVDVELLGLLLGMHAGSGSQREYLFRLSFDMDLSLDGFPLIGGMLTDIKFKDGRLLAASRDWQNAEIDEVNQLLALFTNNPPQPVDKPKDAGAVGVGKGISLSGMFQITKEMGFPLFVQFGGDKKAPPATGAPKRDASLAAPAVQVAAAAPVGPATSAPATPSTGNPDARSQSKIDQVIGAVRIKKVAMVFEGGRLGLKLTGGLALAAFEFELIGLQVTVPQSVLNDPGLVTDIEFGLDGFGAEIRQGTLSILGAFLRQHYPEQAVNGATIPAYDEFNGVVQVAFPPFSLTGMGSYAKYGDHPSLFLFVALGFPIPVTAALLIEGMALGFGVHRDLIAPRLDEVLSYPLIQVSVTPPPPIDIQAMAKKMHQYFPPADGLYFVVAGVKFKAFGIVDTVAMLAVKFGRSFEIDLIGVSSIFYPAAFVELAWMARFVPEEGSIYVAGQLTSRSYLFIPQVQLTGGFAVAAWAAGEHQGDFVVSIGGYHPQYQVPAHYPDHISRLGISFHLDPITVKGGVYFAVTPQCLMMGGLLEASLEASYDATVASASFKAAIRLALDAIVFFEPFHYDLTIGADATLDADIAFPFYTTHIHAQLHLDVHVWGPDFSGAAALDVGPKTFDVAFGQGSSVKALPISWDEFRSKFLQTQDKDSNPQDNVCAISVSNGLLAKARTVDGADLYVVDPMRVVIEAKSLIPITDGRDPRLGIAPMDLRGGGFAATHSLSGHENHFDQAEIRDTVAGGIWGGMGLQAPDPSGSSDGLIRDVLTGFRLTPSQGAQTAETHTIPRDSLAYNTDELTLAEQAAALHLVGAGQSRRFSAPKETYAAFTGLGGIDLTPINAHDLLTATLHAFDVTRNPGANLEQPK